MFQPQTSAPVMSSPIAAGEPIWVDLDSPHPDQSRQFYTALFGWDYRISEQFGGHANAHVQGNKAAGISPMPPYSAREGRSAWTVYFASADLAADVGRVRHLGGRVLVGPMQIGDQGHMATCVDAGGATFGLWQDDQHGGFAAYDGPGRLVWAEVNTQDSAPAVSFYRQLLHADAQPLPGADYHQLMHGETGFAGVSGNAQNWDAVGAAGWMVYFSADDVDQTVQRAEQHGGQVLVAPFDMEFGRMAVLADPLGAVFSVMNPQPAGA
ncbi:VOC family protein [Deinococcus sp. D7000]|nr:VOC family protein [Deinococcus sp. D7000]